MISAINPGDSSDKISSLSSSSSMLPLSSAPSQSFNQDATIVVFGASGDLAKKKTFPALFGLYCLGYLPKHMQIIGYARTKFTLPEFHDRISANLKSTELTKNKIIPFLKLISYISGQYDTDEGYLKLRDQITAFENDKDNNSNSNGQNTTRQPPHRRNRLFYLAVPPVIFIAVATQAKTHLYPDPQEGMARLVIEKPFGRDTQTSNELQKSLSALWTESEIYRIDHYLGKEMVKSILLFRFGNIFFNPAYNNNNIANIQIIFKEKMGTQGRGGYFNDIGIIRDVIQNHLIQILCLMTMERPVSTDSEDIRDEKVKVLRAISPITLDDVILGQYGPSEEEEGGQRQPGYMDDETVPQNSRALTYAAVRLFIDNERWEGVPIILRAGKALNESKVEVRIQYLESPRGMYKDLPRNELVLRVQPNECIYLKMNAKLPGYSEEHRVVTDLDLSYKQRYANMIIPDAYEALFLDCLNGDHTNFVRADELDLAWQVFSPLLEEIDKDESIKPEIYPFGSRGPASLMPFLEKKANYKATKFGEYTWPVTKAK